MSDLKMYRKPALNAAAAFWYTILIIFLPLLVLALYTLVHESGHGLVGLLFGGKINAFSVNFFNLSAHIGIDGTFTPLQQALICAAGVSLPVLLCMTFLMVSIKKSNPILDLFKFLLFMCTVNSMLAWVVIPLLVMFGQTASDDSFNFLNITHLPPLLVTGVVLAVYLVCWSLFFSSLGGLHAIRDHFRNLVAHIKRPTDLCQPEVQMTLRSLAALAVVTASLIAGLTLAFPDQGFQPPADYQKVAEIQLSQGPLQDESIYHFDLDQSVRASIFFGLDQVKGGPMRIHLTGNNGYDNVFFDFPDKKAAMSKSSVHPQAIPLEKGEYEIRATFQPCQGRLRIYIKIE